jgi:hypothetical protein
MIEVKRWGRGEWTFTAEDPHAAPLDVRMMAEFQSSDGRIENSQGFWDGDKTWKVRFSPGLPGIWTWRTQCDAGDAGLDQQSGSFVCIESPSTIAFYRHGRVTAHRGESFLRHADGTPFFWMGDTAWNGVLKARMEDWGRYLADRSEKHFNVIQFVTTQWLSAAGNADARLAYIGSNPIEIDPVFFRWMDARIDLLNDRGFLGAAVIAWAATWNRKALGLSPGTALGNSDLVLLGRYLLARYGAHHMAWILAGDGLYESDEANRWREIGRLVFAGSQALATTHAGGHLWIEDEFRNESWFGFHGYQSGHWRGAEAARWITHGPASQNWHRTPALPHINLEFCYEGHKDFDTQQPFDSFDIRRDAYGSLLAAPPAGLTYGCHGVWSWESEPALPMSHPKTGLALPWWQAMTFPGSDSMKILRSILESIEWWRLRPAPELLLADDGASAAISPERDLALVYSPSEKAPAIKEDMLVPGIKRHDIDPATGGPHSGAAVDRVVLFRFD